VSEWTWSYHEYRPEQEALREALCTVGNGYFATRGAAPEARADGVHYPGTYLAGGYNRATTQIKDRMIENEDLVNLPNWLVLRWRIEDGDWLDLGAVELLAYRQTLDLRNGLLVRAVRLRDSAGRETGMMQRRLVHMSKRHLAALETEITACNWSGSIEIASGIDGTVVNDGVARYRALEGRHLETLEIDGVRDDGIYLKTRTRQSRLEVALAARTRAYRAGRRLDVEPSLGLEPDRIEQTFRLHLEPDTPVTVDKVVAIYTSRDHAISECGLEARRAIERAPGFGALLGSHATIWHQLWKHFDLELTLKDDSGDLGARTTSILRLHLYHLLTTASPNVMDLDVGIPARGLHGEAYRGHIFWDELFIFPLLTWQLPEITRSLLLYRYRRLEESRAAAHAAGLRGALYPWQSGSNGREESQSVHLNPRSGNWIPDETQLQRHVGSAIAFNVWHYYETTGDSEFLSAYGAEMLLEIARFWAGMAIRDQSSDRYEICGVVGPDEFHTRYPDRSEPGLNNHAYTNLMAVWVLCRALELPAHLPRERWEDLTAQLALTQDELAHWDRVSRRLRVCFHDDGIISQFEGYDRLQELDWEDYRRRYEDIHRLDRILDAEGDSPNRYKISKQADVQMLFYLFSTEELDRLFKRLGYSVGPDVIPRTIAYYGSRTSHGSTLSRVVSAWVLARSDRASSWSLFIQALESDVADIQGGTTSEGIHLGAMAGTVDLIQRCYTGIEIRDGQLWLNPMLPDELKSLRLRIRFRGQTVELDISHARVRVQALSPERDTLSLRIDSRLVSLAAGETLEVKRESQPLAVEGPR
jgi:alpha,alpha-trehalase